MSEELNTNNKPIDLYFDRSRYICSNKSFRTLNASEIEVRNNGIRANSKGAYGNFLIYKNARVDISILNETYGRKWKRYHRVEGKYFVCGVSVYNDDLKEWVSYEDTGEPSNSHSDKGLFSDSFKRACVNLGIGIELYTAPNIRIDLNSDDYTKSGDNYKLWTSFFVSEIAYDDKRNIVKLVIKDDKNTVRFIHNSIDDSLYDNLYKHKYYKTVAIKEYKGMLLHELDIADLNIIKAKINKSIIDTTDDKKEIGNKLLENIDFILKSK